MKDVKAYSLTAEILLVLSLAYLCAEVFFNISLLSVAGDVRSSPAELDYVQLFGRIVSASGFTLLILGLFVRYHFRLSTFGAWGAFLVVAALCLFPFGLILGQGTQATAGGMQSASEIVIWGFVPVWGVILVMSGRGYYQLPVVIGLVLLAWPAMFFGQKILIDRYVVDPTTWQQRLNARYVLMLRSGLEGCVVELDGLSLCSQTALGPQMRTVRVLIGALFMHDSDRVLKDLEPERAQIIESVTVWGKWFSPDERYQAYLDLAGREHKRIEKTLIRKYWEPYRKASERYADAISDKSVRDMTAHAWEQSGSKLEQGWNTYQSTVRFYKKSLMGIGAQAAGYNAIAAPLYEGDCRYKGRDCQAIVDAREAVARIQRKANDKFVDETGYLPDLKTKEEFLEQPRTQNMLRESVMKARRDFWGSGDDLPDLPADWKYEEAVFKKDIASLVRGRADREWALRFGRDIPPGLGFDAFLAAAGVKPLPPLEDVVMSEAEFKDHYIVPAKNKKLDEALKKISDEAPGYANGQPLEEWGKNYIRALYIPAIALTLSLVIVMLTLGRYFVTLGCMAMDKIGFLAARFPQKARVPFLAALFLIVMTAAAYTLPNAATSNPAYHKYLGYAVESFFPTALVLDWVNHVEPVLHFMGRWIAE